MLISDFTAVRNDLLDQSGTAPAFAGTPERLFVGAIPESRTSRLLRVIPSSLVSVAVHAVLTIAFLLIWHAMAEDISAPDPIAVDLVRSIPGEGDTTASGKSEPKAETEQPKSAQAQPEQPKPQPSALDEALPAIPGTSPSAAGPSPSSSTAGSGQAVTMPTRQPALVAPPPEPKQAATQAEKNQKANASEETIEPPLPPAPVKAPEAPQVLTAPESETTVPPSSTNPDTQKKPDKPVDADPQASTDATAALAAALPMGAIALPSTFRARLSSQGHVDSQQYKGVVYGMLGRGRAREVAQQAESRGLKGQVIVGLTISDRGAIESIGVVQSSGQPEVDATAVELVRGAAPFPPPPPGTQRSFTPAISFGE